MQTWDIGLECTLDHRHPKSNQSISIPETRTMAQLGLSAFRNGLVQEAHGTPSLQLSSLELSDTTIYGTHPPCRGASLIRNASPLRGSPYVTPPEDHDMSLGTGLL